MMRNLLVCLLALSAISAQASTRVVSRLGKSDSSRAAACTDAKQKVSESAVWEVGQGERVVSMGQCECDQTKTGTWQCSVTGRIAKNNENSSSQGGGYEAGVDSGSVEEPPRESGVLRGIR